MFSSVWRTCAMKSAAQIALRVPADHATGHDQTAIGCHAVGIALRHRPAARLQDLRAGRRRFALCTGNTASVGPFDVFTKSLHSIQIHSAAIPADAEPACAICRSANRRSLPVSVFGSCATNSIARGYL